MHLHVTFLMPTSDSKWPFDYLSIWASERRPYGKTAKKKASKNKGLRRDFGCKQNNDLEAQKSEGDTSAEFDRLPNRCLGAGSD